ncbi:MAG TPA: amino acid adenylation domain-containing protein [Pyrinomonadaceae bacterium]|nr:amino acid adenylation domain-containing protein [Pyrinomonadaceae bacterium]
MSLSVAQVDIKQKLAALSPAKRALLELKLMKKSAAKEAVEDRILPRGENGPAPLSYNQQGLWVLSQLMPDTWLYQIPKALRLTGNLNLAALQQTLDAIVARHDALRTTFTTIDETPMQEIAEPFSLEMPVTDLGHLPDSGREVEAQRILTIEGRRPFNLSQGPLIRSLLLRMQDNEHILLVTTHHIVTDGWSMGIFHTELMELYEAFAAGRPSPLPELPIQYADYAVWHRGWFTGATYESQLGYWKQRFETLPPALELPTDHSRANLQTYRAYRGTQRTLRLSKDLTRKINEFCRREEVTPFMTLLATFKAMLHRYTGEEDIVVGSPIAGRCMAEAEPLIGLFINVLALRVNLAGDPTFRELLGRVKDTALGAYANQDLPFETLVRELQPDRTLTHNPIFQVMFVLQNEPIPPLEFGGLTTSHVQVENVTTNFDLTLDIVERDGEFHVKFEGNAGLFEADTIERMMGHFETLVSGAIEDPSQKLSRMPLLTADERQQLLVEWTNTKADYPAHTSIQQLFEEQVAATPDAVAIVSAEEELTYRELNARANCLAHSLRKHGVERETRVGICLERSPDLIVSVLGILKAGGAYVPLDPTYPAARLHLMIEDAEAPVILTTKAARSALPPSAVGVICIDELRAEVANESRENPAGNSTGSDLAYVIFTSGSTGRPKGVTVTHQSVLRLVKNTNYANFSPDEVFLQYAPISFDASTFEIWGSLLNGARLALMTAGKASLKELGDALKHFQVTTLWLTAGLFHLMVDNHIDDLRGLRQLLAGGDVLSVPHVHKVLKELKNCRFINGYGPTENTTFTCCFPVTTPNSINGSVPIGKPISNTYVYVLDTHMNPVPVGVPGELFIGGDGLARNYMNRPLLTNEKFIRDPFSEKPGSRLYRSGDMVRYRPGGNIEFLGRIDNQVKVRGFRIELGEVEATLAQHPSVRDVVVMVCKDEGDKHLVAYLTAHDGCELDVDEVRHSLEQKLPGHMIPSTFMVLDAMPLSPSGKIDRCALPSANGFKPKSKGVFVAPTDEFELKLARIWERVLNLQPVGIHDNFFDLGGHSLLAVRLFALIEKAFGKNLPLATLFQAPTVAQLARAVRNEGWPAPWSSLVMIQGNGTRRPFFCVHAAGGNVLEYHDLARLLGPDQPFYGLQAKGLNGKDEPHTSIKEMAAHYIQEMREVQPEGPYLIGGRSSGGTIAFEMACQLEAAGEQVTLLALLDVYPAGYFKLLPQAKDLRARIQRRTRRVSSHLNNLRQLGLFAKIGYLRSKLAYAPAKIKHKLYRRAYKIYQSIGQPLPAVLKNIEELNFIATKEYVPQSYPGRATLFSASDLTASYDVEDGWRQLVAELEVHKIPGNHLDIIREPHVQVLAEKLNLCLQAAQNQSQPSST